VSSNWQKSQPPSTWPDWSLREWDPASGKELRAVARHPPGEVHYVAISPDGSRVVTVLNTGKLILWEGHTGKEIRQWQGPITDTFRGTEKFPWPAINDPIFAPEGQTLLATAKNRLYRWNVNTGKELPELQVPADRVIQSRCAPSPDNRIAAVAVVGEDGAEVFLLDMGSGQVLRQMAAGRDWLHLLAFSPDGKTLVGASLGMVLFWETATGAVREQWAPTPGAVFVSAFSPDGRLLALAGDPEGVVRLWHLPSGQRIRYALEQRGRASSLAFSPDGSRLLLGSYSSMAVVCDVAELWGGRLPGRRPPLAGDLEKAWSELGGIDSPRAYRAIWQLAEGGSEVVAFLKERLKASPGTAPKRLAQLIADLDNDAFAVREKASAELEGLGIQAAEALRDALRGQPSTELKLRAGILLEKLGATKLPSADLIRLRIIEILENNDTPEARRLLEELAKGEADSPLTREAKASRDRLVHKFRK